MRLFTNAILLIVAPAMVLPCAADDQPLAAEHQTVAAIDRIFRATWKAEEIVPAAPADDTEYLRRLYLDLAGRIPAVSEIRSFTAEQTPDKRRLTVEHLLDSPASVRHFTTMWRNALLPQANSQPQFRALVPGFEAWLWKHFSGGSSYDTIVREIISTDLNLSNGPALASTTSPDAFYVVRDVRPENLASGTARAFLGVRLDCAQCHDHPFDDWKQEQFWNLAAFYSGFSRGEGDDDNPAAMVGLQENKSSRTIRIPSTEQVVPAVFLTGARPDWGDEAAQAPREVLADWIVADDNPWFARMAVNRVWAQFFGRGIVDPVDDFSELNPPSHPQVLDILARDFVASGYDLKRLVRIVTATEVYQLSSRQSHASQADPVYFARAVLRGLTPEQLFDSLAEAVGFYQPFRSDNPFVVNTNSPRAQFLDLFRDSSESALDRETTILQALAMMNGEFINNATSLDDSRTLKAVLDFPAMTDRQRLETLFLAALSRSPTAAEQKRFEEYLDAGGATDDRNAAMSDVFWVLLNSSEFSAEPLESDFVRSARRVCIFEKSERPTGADGRCEFIGV